MVHLKAQENFQNRIITIFLLPPSPEELQRRLENRGQDTQSVIMKRLSKARLEISYCQHYDYVICNEVFSVALSQLMSIIYAERLKIAKTSFALGMSKKSLPLICSPF